MCATCGCAGDGVRVDGAPVVSAHDHGDDGHHDHSHSHHDDDQHHDDHDHHDHHHDDHHHHDTPAPAHTSEPDTETVSLEVRVLAKNDALAAHNRSWLAARGLVAVNLMSSPGAGKTTLLETTLRHLSAGTPVWVIEGDQETAFDAERIRAAGAAVVQVNTGSGCHLDASMLRTALETLDPHGGIVLIENVGNLVCPALFDLGEDCRVVIMSVTEGADKPLKYPHIFASASVVLLNKVDLLPYVDFDVERFEHDLRVVNPHVELLPISATRGDGVAEWIDWLQAAQQNSHIADSAVTPHVGNGRRGDDKAGENDQGDHDDRDESDDSHGTSSSGETSPRLMDDDYTRSGSLARRAERSTSVRVLRIAGGR